MLILILSFGDCPMVVIMRVNHLRRGGREVDLDDAAVVERRRVRLQREDEADAPVARTAVQLEHLPPEAELRLGEPLTRILDMLKTLS